MANILTGHREMRISRETSFMIFLTNRAEYAMIMAAGKPLGGHRQGARTMAYYGYTRVSTETQAEHGYGLAAQEQAIRKYAKSNDIELAGLFTDAGISGNLKDDDEDDALDKRAGLMDLLAQLAEGDTVIVMNTSRLWRSDMAKALVKRELIKHKANVISTEQPGYDLYSKDPNGYLTAAIMEALDVYERMNVSLKLARGRTVKARTGAKPAGACPYGYKYAPDKKSVVVVPEEAANVKFMFTQGQKGQSLGQIADALNEKGILSPRGKQWQKGTIRAILSNEFYTGVLYHQGQPIKGTHEAIISKIQFGKVKAQLERRHK